MLTEAQRRQFIHDGYVRVDQAFAEATAAAARAMLWEATGCDPEDRRTWTRPVIRLGEMTQEPFRVAADSMVLRGAFDELVGVGRWAPRTSLGGFPIRFPHPDDAGDTGWHVDASFAPDEPGASYLEWRVNWKSKGRALLMLFLFSDVGENDAPTRIRRGSHLRVARLLASAGEAGLPFLELAEAAEAMTANLEETTATGAAGTVYLCHPFVAHAAQRHRGVAPRFLAQPPLYLKAPLELAREDGDYSLVEEAIRLGLDLR